MRKCYILEINCAHCKSLIATYQKLGKSNLVKMYQDRIIESVIDLKEFQGAIFCPQCHERIATRYVTRVDKKIAYRLVPSAFHKKTIN